MKSYFSALIIILLSFGCNNKEEVTPPITEDVEVLDQVINDEINGVPVVLYGNSNKKFFSAFKRIDDNGNIHSFHRSPLQFPFVFENEDGEIWNIFGEPTERDEGKNLQRINNLIGFWFVFPSFHERIIFKDDSEIINPTFMIGDPADEWLIDRNFVFAGSVKEGIKSIDNPQFISMTSKEFLEDEFYKNLDSDELITAVKIGNEVKLYPHRILEYHEVVNDFIGDQAVAVSYCPLTGTSRAWKREIKGKIHTFGVSGLLYNNNLLLYDRLTDSHWSQILNLSVNGSLAGEHVVPLEVWDIKAEDMINIPGRIKLLSTKTGIEYDYQYPVYGNYQLSDNINFPLQFSNDRVHNKERVIGVTVDNVTKVYRFNDFKK